MALTDQILRQGSSIFRFASLLEEIRLSSSVTQFLEPTTDVSSVPYLTPILVHHKRRSRLLLSLEKVILSNRRK
ncbi:hypothetical protein F2Q69_00007707 [Brassica cretica]|uniref:Uncharacterized protein n=1 Tax=Brassica cretica TaxID=69181 RepID=A0A8S9NXE4_BRACR|nr:hypothetical protein F2Q69_00007707 [Brassica cretica]